MHAARRDEHIADKAALLAEVRRVLVPGGIFGVYDVMRVGPGDITFPVPWTATAATSFLAKPAYYRELLAKAGLTVQSQRDRRNFALDFFREMKARTAQHGPPVLNFHIVMGPDAPLKIANMIDGLTRAVLAPTEMACLAEPDLPPSAG